nr:hypothetical protein [uncultured Lachnoclostridium sp.]
MKKTITGYCITDPDGYVVLVGRDKKTRKIVTIEEKNNTPVWVYQSKKRAMEALKELKTFKLTPSATTYIRGIRGVNLKRNNTYLVVKPCTATFDF